MGYKEKRGQRSLKEIFWQELRKMAAFGESKREAMRNNTADRKIFSHKTMQIYLQQAKEYADWLEIHYQETRRMKEASSHVIEYLEEMCNQTASASTVQTAAKALGKLFQIKPESPDYFTPPKRERGNITRSRNKVARDSHFSKTKNSFLIDFCESIGPRRSELEKMKGKDLISIETIKEEIQKVNPSIERNVLSDALLFPDIDYFVLIKGKGGRKRLAPIIGPDDKETVKRIQQTQTDQKVWDHVHTSADIHSFRAMYAAKIYRKYARKIEDIPYDTINKGSGKWYQSDVYVCRKDESKRKLDRRALLLCSKALGHNRVSVVAEHYLWAL